MRPRPPKKETNYPPNTVPHSNALVQLAHNPYGIACTPQSMHFMLTAPQQLISKRAQYHFGI